MDLEKAINLIDELVFEETNQHLSSIQINLLKGVWLNLSYEQLAQHCYCSVSNLKIAGSAFWGQLSQVLGEKVTKKNLRTILELYVEKLKIDNFKEGKINPSDNKLLRGLEPQKFVKLPEQVNCWFDCDFWVSLTDRLDYSLESINAKCDVDLSQLKKLIKKLRLIHNLSLPNYSFQPTSLDIIKISRNSINNLRLDFPNRQIILSLFEEPILPDYDLKINVLIDENLVQNILENLLINALQYSTSQSLVTLEVNVEEQKIILTIIDEGIGIPNQELEQIFRPFYRATNANPNSGDGLGLFIVEKSVKLHQGEISVASDIKSGSVFQVILPVV